MPVRSIGLHVPRHSAIGGFVLVAALVLAGCAGTPASPGSSDAKPATQTSGATTGGGAAPGSGAATNPPAANAAAGTGGTAGTGATPATAAGQLRPFAEIVKDAKESPGLFRVWQKDEKVWLELAPGQFGQPLFFTVNLSQGVGEYGVYGGMMLKSHVAYFRRVGNHVQLLARNTQFTAGAALPIAAAVREGFSDSLIATSTVVSQPHPERKTVLVDANALLLADIPVGTRFTAPVHVRGYQFDVKNSFIERIRNSEAQSSFVVAAHYANPRASLPPPPTPTPTPNPFPTFRTLPDARSLFLGLHYNFAPLPEPMATRPADPRIGHFATEVWDFSTDLRYTPKTFQVVRWRLEKKDPAAALSEPRQPIVYWIDRNVPEAYRGVVREGILEWNRAFERIGFRDAIVVRQQEADADFDTADARHATVRWYTATDSAFAIGPSHVDPRTGEILDADVAIPDSWARTNRDFVVEQVPPGNAGGHDGTGPGNHSHAWQRDGESCTYAVDALAETQFGLELLAARGEIAPDGPAAEAFVRASLKAAVIHEVGHTLGLRHNFRASTVYTLDQVSDPAFTRERGISGSIMDYNPINLAAQGEPQADFFERGLGPYDYWAIEYAYRPLAPETAANELEAIAARGGTDPLLAFSSDQEVSAGIDPDASQFDLGADPLAYLQKRLLLSRELWDRLQQRQLAPGQSYYTLRRDFDAGFRQITRAMPLIAKYVGGVSYVRDFAGTGRLPLTPVPAAKQRAALRLLADSLLSDRSFRFHPDFLRELGVDYLQVGYDQGPTSPDFSLRSRVLGLQKDVLARLFDDAVAARILDSEDKVGDPREAFRLSELYDTVQAAVWSEIATPAAATPRGAAGTSGASGGRPARAAAGSAGVPGTVAPASAAGVNGPASAIGALRRDLQREHLRRIVATLARPATATPADTRALQRENARLLLRQLHDALARADLDKETRAHLAESANTLDEVLKAPFVRQGS